MNETINKLYGKKTNLVIGESETLNEVYDLFCVTDIVDIAFIIVNGRKNFLACYAWSSNDAHYKQSLLLDENDLDQLGDFLRNYSQKHDAFLIYKGYPCKMDKETFEKRVSAITGYGKYKIVDSYMGDIYLFQK